MDQDSNSVIFFAFLYKEYMKDFWTDKNTYHLLLPPIVFKKEDILLIFIRQMYLLHLH